MGACISLLLDEHKAKELKLKRIIAILVVLCIVSASVHVVNFRRAEQIRQLYMSSIIDNLSYLEVLLSGIYWSIESEENLFDSSSWHSFEYTIRTIDNNVRRLAKHENIRMVPPSMSVFEWHLRTLLNEEHPEAAQDFISRRRDELSELVSPLTIEIEVERIGRTVAMPNYRLPTRQVFNYINTFTQCVTEEVLEYLHRQHRN